MATTHLFSRTSQPMNKEGRNQFLIPLPSWMTRFIKHLHLTPQGLLTKPGKNMGLIIHTSLASNKYKYNVDS